MTPQVLTAARATQEPGALLKDGRGLLYLGVRGGTSKEVSLSRDLSDKHSSGAARAELRGQDI